VKQYRWSTFLAGQPSNATQPAKAVTVPKSATKG